MVTLNRQRVEIFASDYQ